MHKYGPIDTFPREQDFLLRVTCTIVVILIKIYITMLTAAKLHKDV